MNQHFFSLHKNKKRVFSLMLCLVLMATMSFGTGIQSFALSPTDISTHWAKDTIQSWLDQGFIKGYPDGSFKPDNNISRAEFMTLVNKAFGYTASAQIAFSDVKADAWYAGAVAIAKAAGYIGGYPDGTMKPDSPISREEAAVIIMKIKNLQADPDKTSVFTDAASLSWSKGAVGAVVGAAIMQGYPDGSFGPQKLIKRGEGAVSLDRANKYVMEAGAPLVTRNDDTNTVSGMTTAMEYKLDSANWTLYVADVFNKLNLKDNHTMLVRFAATGANPFGPTTTLVFTTDVVIAGGGGGGAGGGGAIGGGGGGTVGTTVNISGIVVAGTGGSTTIVIGGTSLHMIATVTPSNATNQTIVWTVAPLAGGAATIDPSSGLLTGTISGTVRVTATNAASGISGFKDIIVQNGVGPTINVSAITVAGTAGDNIVNVGGAALQMIATVTPSNATNQTIVWTVAPLVGGAATIDVASGLLTGTVSGTVRVTATNTASGIFGFSDITVSNDIGLVAAAKAAIMAGNYSNLVVADINNQTLKTQAVQAVVNTLKGTVTATVNWNAGLARYDILISKGLVNDTYSITTATFVLSGSSAVAAAKLAIASANYANLSVADVTSDAQKIAAVQAVVDTVKGTTTAVVSATDIPATIFSVAISQNGVNDTASITTATFTSNDTTLMITDSTVVSNITGSTIAVFNGSTVDSLLFAVQPPFGAYFEILDGNSPIIDTFIPVTNSMIVFVTASDLITTAVYTITLQ